MKFSKIRKTKTITENLGMFCNLNTNKGCELLVDTGTYMTFIPRPMFYQIFKGYSIKYFENCNNYLKGKLPTIIFEMESDKGRFNLNLEPEDYLNKYIDNEI
jgi:hypothetical protein